MNFDNTTILVTGGSGSFGRAFIKELFHNHNPKKVIIYSRDEMKHWHMQNQLENDARLRFFIGDVRDKERLYSACKGVDYVIHAAALKIVPAAEYNPIECINTNILGAVNVIEAASSQGVKRVVALSTDKASAPINLYGASKLCSDKLFIAANSYGGGDGTRFSVVRYGNVMGSRGSVIPLFLSMREKKTLPITHQDMTRFMITLEQGIELVNIALETMQGGEIYVKKIPSMKVVDIAKAISPKCKLHFIGMRPGEKIHEQMIGPENSPYTYEYDSYFKIFPEINLWRSNPYNYGDGKLVAQNYRYSSENNTDWMSQEQLLAYIDNAQFIE